MLEIIWTLILSSIVLINAIVDIIFHSHNKLVFYKDNHHVLVDNIMINQAKHAYNVHLFLLIVKFARIVQFVLNAIIVSFL